MCTALSLTWPIFILFVHFINLIITDSSNLHYLTHLAVVLHWWNTYNITHFCQQYHQISSWCLHMTFLLSWWGQWTCDSTAKELLQNFTLWTYCHQEFAHNVNYCYRTRICLGYKTVKQKVIATLLIKEIAAMNR